MKNAIKASPVPNIPETVPLRNEPEVDPFREVREMAEAIRADCQVLPEEYLDEVRVTGGGE